MQMVLYDIVLLNNILWDMVKVKLEILLNSSWDGYIDPIVSDDALLQDLLTTLSDQRVTQEEVVSITIKSKQLL